ncbi:MAG: hypothetical protein AAFY76_00600, partial [Cyanobacteria bacterium J06649_11]
LIDPTGREPEGWSDNNKELADIFGLFGNGGNGFHQEFGNGSGGYSQLSYTLNEDYSHTVTSNKRIQSTNGNILTRTETAEIVSLSSNGEILSSTQFVVKSQAEITGKITSMNALDGMEVMRNEYGPFIEISRIKEEGVSVSELNKDLQNVVAVIQEKTRFNQKYDYIKEDAAEENFQISVAYLLTSSVLKLPTPARIIGGIGAAGAAYHNSTRDNRGRTVYTYPKYQTE